MIAQEQVNILLVDDQPAKLLSYEVILAELGENLIKANSAREALEFLLKNDVAVVLVDVCMPELDGFELAKMLREHPRYEKTAIIFISAIHLSDLDRVRGYETGAVDYVPVPVVPEILRAKVKIFVELWRKTRQLEQLNDELERRVRERTAELRGIDRPAARDRRAAPSCERGRRLRHLRLQRRVGQAYWSPYMRGMVGIAGDEPLTLEAGARGRAPRAPRHGSPARAQLHPGNGAPRAGVQDRPTRRRGSLAVGSRPGCPRQADVRCARDGHDPRYHRQEAQRGTPVPADGRARPSREEHPEQRLGCRPSFEPSRAVGGGVRGLASTAASRRSRARTACCAGAPGPVRASPIWPPMPLRRSSRAATSASTARRSASFPRSRSRWRSSCTSWRPTPSSTGPSSTASGRVKLSWSRPSTGQLRFVWQESGGPRTVPPATKGFGLTVLQTAASDLGAVANYHFGDQGFLYTLQGPFEHAQPMAVVFPFSRPAEVPAPIEKSPAVSRVLVVEDEALVALQLQHDLEQAGHHIVGPARSLKHGLMLASQEHIDAALLDVSLGADQRRHRRPAPRPKHSVRLCHRLFPTAHCSRASAQIPKLSKPLHGQRTPPTSSMH